MSWEQIKLNIGEDEKETDYRNKSLIFYPKEIWDILVDVLKTFEENNVSDFGFIDKDFVDRIVCVLAEGKDEKDQQKRLDKDKVLYLRPIEKERARALKRLRNFPIDDSKYEIYIVAEKWKLLSKHDKIQEMIRELLHFSEKNPDKFRKFDRFAREYELMAKYLELKERESVTITPQMVAVAVAKKKKKVEEERD